MRIVRAGVCAFELRLVRPLATAHGSIGSRAGFLVTLEDESGRYGSGEATPLPDFGTEDLATCRRSLERSLHDLVSTTSEATLAERWQASLAACQAAPCARSAIDTALHDLAAQRAGCSLADWLRRSAGLLGPAARAIEVQALIGGTQPEDVAESARAALHAKFRSFKLKLAVSPGASDLSPDLERVAALRETVGPASPIRLDANEAWTEAEAEAALADLARFRIDYVEQPVSRSDLAALARLDRAGAIPVAADEALLGDGLERCLEARAARILIAKPAALGGIGAALDLYARASALDLQIVWSSLIDGAVARSAAVAIAAALSEEGSFEGLGTAGLLAEDLTAGTHSHSGTIPVPSGVGLGVGVPPAWAVSGACFGEAWQVGSSA